MNQKIIIQDPQIEPKRDKNGKLYFLVHDQTTSLAYFAFYGSVKKGWFDLETKYFRAKEIHLELIDRKTIASLQLLTKREVWIKKHKLSY